MKRLLLVCAFVAVLIFPSCSSDDDGPNDTSVVTARINGVDYTFNTVNVDTETFTEGGFTYTDVIVTASIDSNPDNRISFIVEQGVTGLDASYYFAYFLNETAHPKIEPFMTAVTKNTSNRLEGSFSGQVQADEAPFEIIDIENGTFDISY
jgi:hypothetical protein